MAEVAAAQALPRERLRGLPARYRGRLLRRTLGGLAILAIIASVTVVPLLLLSATSVNVAAPGQPFRLGLDAYARAFGNEQTVAAIGMTVLLVFLRIVPAVILGAGVAYLLARTDLPWKSTIEFLLWLSFFFPAFPLALGWMLLMDPKSGLLNHIAPIFNIYSIGGITWVHFTSSTLPVMVILLTPAFRLLAPAFEDAAIIAGSSRLEAIRRIVLPVLMPTIFGAFTAGIIKSLESFEIELLLGKPANIFVYATRIYQYVSYEPIQLAPAVALSTVFVVVLVGLALYYQLVILRKQYTTVLGQGFSPRPIRLGKWRSWLGGGLLCYCLIVLLLPAGLLVIGSFMRIYGFFDIANPFTLRHWQIVLNDSIFWPSVRNTLVLAIGAAVLAVTMYAALAFMLVRGHVRFRGAITLLGWLPWAIPGVLVGIALVQTFLAVPFLSVVYGSMAALILARLIASMPLSLQMFQSSIQQIHKELDECSSVVGASSVTTFRKIIFPLIAPMAVSVGVIAFIGAARDISTLVLLSNNATRPLSVLMLEYSIGGELERGAVVGVITTALVVGVALIARRFGLGLRGL